MAISQELIRDGIQSPAGAVRLLLLEQLERLLPAHIEQLVNLFLLKVHSEMVR